MACWARRVWVVTAGAPPRTSASSVARCAAASSRRTASFSASSTAAARSSLPFWSAAASCMRPMASACHHTSHEKPAATCTRRCQTAGRCTGGRILWYGLVVYLCMHTCAAHMAPRPPTGSAARVLLLRLTSTLARSAAARCLSSACSAASSASAIASARSCAACSMSACAPSARARSSSRSASTRRSCSWSTSMPACTARRRATTATRFSGQGYDDSLVGTHPCGVQSLSRPPQRQCARLRGCSQRRERPALQ